jgi:hypothetical protein
MLSVVMNNVVKLIVAAPQEHLSENSKKFGAKSFNQLAISSTQKNS